MLKSPSKQTFLKLDLAAFSEGETLHINCDTSPLGGLYARMNRIFTLIVRFDFTHNNLFLRL